MAGTQMVPVPNRSVVQQILQELYDTHGALTPDLVVREARDPGHPLHAAFEWDDKAAADGYRRKQAGDLIRSVKIRVTRQGQDGEITEERVRAWVPASHVGRAATPGAYLPVTEVDAMGRAVLLQRMLRDLAGLRRRFGHLSEFWAELDKMAQEGNGGEAA